jgi:hypothetical protein
MTSDAETGYTARPDGTPVSNVMLQWLADRTTQRTWWRQDDDTWTDGDTICPWPDIERQGNNVTAYRPLSDPRILLHTALVEGDGLARALLAGELERFYGEEGWPQPRYHAIVELTRNPVLPLDQLLVATLVHTLDMSAEQVVSAVEPALRDLPARHLWESDHPFYGAGAYGEVEDDTEFDTFDQLRQCLNRHSDGGSTVIYRWDWTDSTSHLLDGPDAENPGPDEFVVYGLLPRKAHLFVLRCPISKDQERDVVQWLRGPRMLGALRDLWSPLLDTVPATPRRPGDPS